MQSIFVFEIQDMNERMNLRLVYGWMLSMSDGDVRLFCKHVTNDHSNEEDNAQVNDHIVTSLFYAKKQLNITKNIIRKNLH